MTYVEASVLVTRLFESAESMTTTKEGKVDYPYLSGCLMGVMRHLVTAQSPSEIRSILEANIHNFTETTKKS